MNTPIRAVRLKRGQTLGHVAKSVATNIGNLSRIETGRQLPSPALAARLASHFGHEVTEMQLLFPERYAQ